MDTRGTQPFILCREVILFQRLFLYRVHVYTKVHCPLLRGLSSFGVSFNCQGMHNGTYHGELFHTQDTMQKNLPVSICNHSAEWLSAQDSMNVNLQNMARITCSVIHTIRCVLKFIFHVLLISFTSSNFMCGHFLLVQISMNVLKGWILAVIMLLA